MEVVDFFKLAFSSGGQGVELELHTDTTNFSLDLLCPIFICYFRGIMQLPSSVTKKSEMSNRTNQTGQIKLKICEDKLTNQKDLYMSHLD